MAKGTCLCQGIEITTSIEPKATVACSCTSCQACSSAPFTINLVYPKGTIEVTKGKEHVKIFKGEQVSLSCDQGSWDLPICCDKYMPLVHSSKIPTWLTMNANHVETAESGNEVLRHFCDTCGNAVYTQAVDGTCYVKAPVMKGLHNDPVAHIFTRNLPAWAEDVKTGDRKKGGASS